MEGMLEHGHNAMLEAQLSRCANQKAKLIGRNACKTVGIMHIHSKQAGTSTTKPMHGCSTMGQIGAEAFLTETAAISHTNCGTDPHAKTRQNNAQQHNADRTRHKAGEKKKKKNML